MIPASANPMLMVGDAGYRIERSLRVRRSASAYLARTFGTATDRKKFTISFWTKQGAASAIDSLFCSGIDASNVAYSYFRTDGGGYFQLGDLSSGTTTFDVRTAAQFRDFAAHMHVVVTYDSTQTVASDRIKVSVNGNPMTLTGAFPALNAVSYLNAPVQHLIGATPTYGRYYDGLFSDIYFIDGQALPATAFGEFDLNDTWNPKKYTGIYGNNGVHLEFKGNSAATAEAIGKDTSGNGNNWTPANISVTAGITNDSLIDIPTNYDDGGNGRGNYAVLNSLSTSGGGVLSNGNLTLTSTSSALAPSTIAIPKGKYYCEMTATSIGAPMVGIAGTYTALYPGYAADGYGYYYNGNKYNNAVATAWGPAANTNDVIGIAYDSDSGKLWFSVNGVWAASGNPETGANPAFTVADVTKPYYFAAGSGGGGATTVNANFGQRPFAFAPPAGFKALNTQNMPSPSVPRSRTGFDIVLRAGTGTAGAVSTLLFKFGLLWSKCRNAAVSHTLINSVRGAGKGLSANQTTAESLIPNAVTSINDNGYAFGSSVGDALEFNTAGRTFVDWLFRRGPAYGFDAIEYVGNGVQRAITHAAGKAPSVVIVKSLAAVSGAGNWPTGHSGIPTNWGNEYLYLDAQDKATGSGVEFMWGNPVGIPPTSTTVTLGTSKQCNQNGTPYVMFVWSEVPGFSKFGSYAGNNSADGPFVHCDFEPALVILKCYNVAGTNWVIKDNRRSGINPADGNLYSNSSLAEDLTASVYVDLVSNGFKIRGNYASINSGSSFVYMAFAANPFKTARAR